MFQIKFHFANQLFKSFSVRTFRNYFRSNPLRIVTTRYHRIPNENFRNSRFNKKFSVICIGIFSFFKSKDNEDTPENLFAKALFAIENDNLNNAIYYLTEIIRILENQFEKQEITYLELERKRARIKSELANVYLLKQNLDKAAEMIIATMKSCFEAEIVPSDPVIVELSLKLALIYEEQQNFVDADTGFRFCVENCRIEMERKERDEEETRNLNALLGMVYNYYSKFLYRVSKYNHALDMASKSIDQALKVYDENHPNIINLINDQGVIFLALKDYDNARSKFQKAVDICLDCPKDDVIEILPSIYANLGHLFLEIADPMKAEEMCQNSRRYLRNMDNKKIVNNSLEAYIDDCFFKLAGLKSMDRED